MKKSKFITGLSAAFISAMALMSCSSIVKEKSGVVLTIDGVPYTAEELFEDQKTPAAAEAKFNAVYKVAVRAYFKKHTEDNEEIAKNTKIKINEQKAIAQSNAEKSGTSYDEEWQKILDANDVEDEDGLYSKFEYDLQKEKFENKLYDNNYDTLREGGFLKNKDGEAPADQEKVPGYLENKIPYHMKHILVKVGAADGDNVTGTISAEEASNLYNVINELAKGTSFEDVSKVFNEDETAKANGGSLGIMSRDTSFVDDFKLGTYFYEAYYGSSTQTNEPTGTGYEAIRAIDKLFATGSSAATYAQQIYNLDDPISKESIGIIPFGAALALAPKNEGGFGDFEYKDTNLEKAGVTKDQFKDKYLPRNVIFNKYFNKHGIMIIAPDQLPTITANDVYGQDGSAINDEGQRTKPDNYTCTLDPYIVTSTVGHEEEYREGFSKPAKNGDEIVVGDTSGELNALQASIGYKDTSNVYHQHVLRDDEGRIIFAFRSGTGGSSSNEDTGYQGIHFVVIERSPFIGREFDEGSPESGDEDKITSLKEYYTEYYPEQSTGDSNRHHPVYGEYHDPDPEKLNDWKHTFSNYFMEDPEIKNKKERAETVKSELKKCTSDLNTYIYDYLLKDGEITFNQESEIALSIQTSIETWIGVNRDDQDIETKHNWDNNWQTYYLSLAAKNEDRDEANGIGKDGNYHTRLIPEYCAVALELFEDNIDALRVMFGAGGVFHE